MGWGLQYKIQWSVQVSAQMSLMRYLRMTGKGEGMITGYTVFEEQVF